MSSYLQDLKKIFKIALAAKIKKEGSALENIVPIFFKQYIPEHITEMDVGVGFCEFINNIVCQEKIALDINPDTIQYTNRGVRVVNDDIFIWNQLPTLLSISPSPATLLSTSLIKSLSSKCCKRSTGYCVKSANC